MPLTPQAPSALRYLLPGTVAGIAAFAFSRVMIEPLIGAAIDYEGAREQAEAQLAGTHEHGHELFTRSVQANFGAAVGIIGFSVAMGVLFAVAYYVLRTVLERRGYRADPTAVALLLAAGMFVVIAWVPSLKYPANPPSVGLEDTIQARSSTFLTITVISVVCACAAVAAGLAWSRRWGPWRASALAVSGYVVVLLVAMSILPNFREVPGPLMGPGGLVLDGFPAEVLAEFRSYSLLNQAIIWLLVGATSACLTAGRARRSEGELLAAGVA